MTYHQVGLNIYDMIEYIQNFRSKITTPENTKKNNFNVLILLPAQKKLPLLFEKKKQKSFGVLRVTANLLLQLVLMNVEGT